MSAISRRGVVLGVGGSVLLSTITQAEIVNWEFGARGWCQFSADTALGLLKASGVDLRTLEWGMSERYDHTPERLRAGRDAVGFHVMVSGGKATGGLGVSDACLALDGMHSRGPWALIAGAAAVQYGQAGQLQRWADEAVLMKAIRTVTGRDVITPVKPTVLPLQIMRALVAGQETGGGLHNLTAARTARSREFAGLPITKLGVPVFSEMSVTQQAAYLKLLGI